MNVLEAEEQKYRVISALAGVVAGIIFIGLMSLLSAPSDAATGEIFLADVLFDRSSRLYPATIQNLMWLLFFVGLSELWVRFNRASHEFAQLQNRILPEDETVMLRAKDLAPVYERMVQGRKSRYFFLQRLAQRVILQFQGSQSIDQANNLMNSSLELMQHEVELKYNMLRYLTWLIPTIGFIGTVIGIAWALSEAANMPDITAGDDIKIWLGAMTTKLALAFNTTLMALMMSAILVFILHIVQGREEMALNGAGQYCMDNLVNRLFQTE